MERPASAIFVNLLSKYAILLLLCDLHSTGIAVLADDEMTMEVTITSVDGMSCSSASSLPVTVLVEYRLLTSTREFTDPQQQWTTLNTASTGENFMETFPIDSEVQDGQFRLLQLQHEGSDCSCWQLEQLILRNSDGRNVYVFDSSKICHHQLFQNDSQRFCGGDRNEARGLITTAWNRNDILECPGFSNQTLFPETIHCDTALPRV